MTAALNFTVGGTNGANYTVPGTHIGYGSTWRYAAAASDGIFSQTGGGFSQMVDATVCSGTTVSGQSIINWGGTGGASEIGVGALNGSRTGWMCILTGTTMSARKEVAGNGGTAIASTASLLGAAGLKTVNWDWNLSNGDFTVAIVGGGTLNGNYSDNLTGMRLGVQNYNDNSAHTIQTLTTTTGAGQSIDSITTGGVSGLVVGQAFNFTTTGLADVSGGINIKTAATPAAQTDAISIVQTAGDGSAAVKFFADGQYMPFPGTATVTITGTGGAPAGNFPFAIPADHFDVIFGTVSLQDNTYLGFALNAIGHPLEGGATPDRAYWINTNGLIFGTDGKISCNSAMTSALWIHKKSGIIEGYTVQINDAGQITIGGIPSSNLLFFLM